MILRTRTTLAITTFALIIFFAKGYSVIAQQPSFSEQQKVVDVISTFFAAAHDDDLAKFNSIVAPGFYAFDNGARFNGDSVMTLIKNLHAAGKRYEWHVTEPDIHIEGSIAWIAYVNKGSITTGSVTSDQQWLESAFLQRQSGNWKIVFIHSTPRSLDPTSPAEVGWKSIVFTAIGQCANNRSFRRCATSTDWRVAGKVDARRRSEHPFFQHSCRQIALRKSSSTDQVS